MSPPRAVAQGATEAESSLVAARQEVQHLTNELATRDGELIEAQRELTEVAAKLKSAQVTSPIACILVQLAHCKGFGMLQALANSTASDQMSATSELENTQKHMTQQVRVCGGCILCLDFQPLTLLVNRPSALI